jgi:hypothetical protein
MVGGAACLHEDQPRGKAAELRLVRIRQDGHGIDAVGRQPDAREVGGRIEERRSPDLKTRLVRAASVNAFAGRSRDDIGEQPKRRINVSARRERLCLGVRHSLCRRKRAGRRNDRRGCDDVDPLGHRGDRHINRDGDDAARHDCDGPLDRFEPIQRGVDAVRASKEIANLYVSRFVGDLFGQLLACGIANEHEHAGKKDGSALCGERSVNRAVDGCRRLRVCSRRAPDENEGNDQNRSEARQLPPCGTVTVRRGSRTPHYGGRLPPIRLHIGPRPDTPTGIQDCGQR